MSERNEAAGGEISVFGKLQAKAGREAEARKTFGALVMPTRSSPGCIQYTLFEDKGAPGVFSPTKCGKARRRCRCISM